MIFDSQSMWLIVLTFAGLGLASCLSDTTLGKRVDPPPADDDSNIPPKKDTDNADASKQKDDWLRSPAGVLLQLCGMLFFSASTLTNVGDDIIPYLSKPASDRMMFFTWLYAIVNSISVMSWSLCAVYYVRGSKTLLWNSFCGLMAGFVYWAGLRLTSNETTWQAKTETLCAAFFVMHIGSVVGFFLHLTPTAKRVYRVIGIQHSLDALQAATDSKEVPAAYVDEKQSEGKQPKLTV